MSMLHPTTGPLIWEGDAAEDRARALGLPGTFQLRQAIDFGAAGARSTSPDHPKAMRGYRMWGDTIAELRRKLRPFGWDADDISNIPVCLLRTEPLIMVAVTAAVGHTGSATDVWGPTLRYPKGEFSTKLYNNELDDLWTSALGRNYQVWLLLHDLTRLSVRSELALPARLDEDGQVLAWAERILLPEMGFEPEPHALRPVRPEAPQIDVDVRRRVG